MKRKIFLAASLIIVVMLALLTRYDIRASFGYQTSVTTYFPSKESGSVRFITSPFNMDHRTEMYVWMNQRTSNRFAGKSDEVGLRWEPDPGSGPDSLGFRKVTDPEELKLVQAYADRTRQNAQPALFPAPDFYSGVVWKSDPSLI